MPLYSIPLNHDEEFQKSETPPIILNDLASRTKQDREYFNNLVRETFTSDIVSVLPKCQCGALKGEHLVGDVCDLCNTPVKQTLEKSIAPSVWFRRPATVEKLLNPIFWIMLDDRFTRSNFRIMQWLTDRNYNPATKRPEIVEQMIRDGIPRGYNSFVQNFDQIMAYLFAQSDFVPKRNQTQFLIDMLGITHPTKDPLQQLIAEHRDKLFSDYIPVLNRTLLVLEQHATGLYLEKTILDVKDALNTMLSIDQDFYDKSQTTLENRTAKILIMLTNYYRSLLKKNIDPKEGILRKHGYGARTNHSFRTVITSHSSIHDHDEIWIPWGVGVTLLGLHLQNRLMDRHKPYGGMTHNEAVGFLHAHVHKYHPVIDQLFKELIAESRYGALICMQQRNREKSRVSFRRNTVDKLF